MLLLLHPTSHKFDCRDKLENDKMAFISEEYAAFSVLEKSMTF